MTQFNDLGLAESILQALTAEGYSTPTPIQQQVIPVMLAGRDVVGIAQTGTGKTAAFVLPLLNEITNRKSRAAHKSCNTLILAPTRELAAQIAESVRTYGRFMRHSVAVVVGGVRPGPQIRMMASGVDILVATPGRLLDHISTGAIRLESTTTVILDEADQMMDLGFMPAIRKIMAKVPHTRRTLLFSATMPKPIRALADDFLHDAVEIAVSPESLPIDRIEQRVLQVEKSAKRAALVNILKESDVERAIVFTRTKHGADKVRIHLEKAGLPADAIHGNKSQGQRERALANFKAGKIRILVATDIAARGIDVDGISHVINFELPNVPEAYVHRIGRTARAGKSGVAISLCDSEERGLLRDIERLIKRTIGENGTTDYVETRQSRGNGSEGQRQPGRSKGRPQNRSGQRGKPRTGHPEQRSDSRGPAKPAHQPRPANDSRPAHRPEKKRDFRQGDEAASDGLARMLGNFDGGRKRPQKPGGPSTGHRPKNRVGAR